MKKFLLLVLGAAFLFASCGVREAMKINEAKDNLANAAEVVNEQAPYEVDYMTTIVSCEFDGKNFIYSYVIDEDYGTIPEMKENGHADDIRSSIEKDWDENPELKIMKDNLKKVGGNVVYEYLGNITGETLCIEVVI